MGCQVPVAPAWHRPERSGDRTRGFDSHHPEIIHLDKKIERVMGIEPTYPMMVLGIASAISPISIITENIIDLCVLIAFTECVWIFAGSKKKIGRVEGFCMVALYADRKSTRLNSSHSDRSRMPSSA